MCQSFQVGKWKIKSSTLQCGTNVQTICLLCTIHTVLHTAKEVRSMVVCYSKLSSPNHRAMTSKFLLLYLEGLPLHETVAVLLIYANNTEWQH